MTKKLGRTNPNNVPTGPVNATIAVDHALSVSGNHVEATLPDILMMKH